VHRQQAQTKDRPVDPKKCRLNFTIETMVSQPEVVEKGNAPLREVTPF